METEVSENTVETEVSQNTVETEVSENTVERNANTAALSESTVETMEVQLKILTQSLERLVVLLN